MKRVLQGIILVAVFLVGTGPSYAQYGFHFGKNKVQYEDFEWQILKTEHLDIYYYPEMGKLAQKAAYFAEAAYREYQDRFGFHITHQIPLILYSSGKHFQQTNVTPGLIPPGVGGFFEFMKGRVVVPSNGDLHRFRRVIRHELIHVFTFTKMQQVSRDHRVASERYLPLWYTEGLAEYWSGPRGHDYEMILRDAVFSNSLVPLDDMHRIAGTYQMYKQGEAICTFIAEHYGEEKLLRLIEEGWRYDDFGKALAGVLKVDYQTLSDQWSSWMYDQYYPRLRNAQSPLLRSTPLGQDGFSTNPVLYKKPGGQRMVYYVANRTGYTNLYAVPVDSQYKPTESADVLIHGERSKQFESFNPLDSRLDVSDTGQLTFVTQSAGQDVIHVYDLSEKKVVHTFRFPSLVVINSPSWSPEGDQLVFSAIDEGGYADLYLYRIDAGQLKQLTRDAYHDRDPDWHPREDRIVFSSDRTSFGKQNAYNLFLYDLETDQISYLTYGDHFDFTPRWSPSGEHILFTSSRRDTTGKLGAKNVWAADITTTGAESSPLVHAGSEPLAGSSSSEDPALYRLTDFATAAFDPTWTPDDHLLFTAFEQMRFQVRHISNLDSLVAHPKEVQSAPSLTEVNYWEYPRLRTSGTVSKKPYQPKYDLDLAHTQITQNPIWGTNGGALLALSDMLGNDKWLFTIFSRNTARSDFLESINFAVARTQLQRRANVSYGAYRFAGLQYDLRDPDASPSFPVLWERVYGGFGSVSFPLSRFRRIELNSSLNWSDKRPFAEAEHIRSMLLSNAVSLVHDNALYGLNGPLDGWRGHLTAGYTTDIVNSNVNYYTLALDLRHYLRLGKRITFASWGLGQLNEGRRARLFLLGGSWNLRGYRLFSVRGQKMWFTSHELRFPLLGAPSIALPLLRPFGIQNLRGAAFVDLAHAWNDQYNEWNPQLKSGRTLGSAGLGLRMNIFRAIVLRYDMGYRFSGDFSWSARKPFGQFFFGYSF